MVIKEHILSILKDFEPTHTELMEKLCANEKDNFFGVQGYGETIKLDLEARKIIEPAESKPEKYRLTSTIQ